MSSNGNESRLDDSAEIEFQSGRGRYGEQRLRPGVARLLAPNPSVMTGPGTNTYVLGTTKRAIVDPGPNDPVHLERLLALGGAELAAVVVTHHHSDHAPLGRILADRAGVPLLAFGHPAMAEVDVRLSDGDVVELDEMSISVVHTPGHASDHCCFFVWSGSGDRSPPPMLLTGDHVMSGSTVVIPPPDGDMTKYLDSLERLLSMSESIGTFPIAPGHGEVIPDGPSKLAAYVQHRLEREQMVLAALGHGPASSADLVPLIYSRLAPSLVRPASASVWAHLRRLGELGQARTEHPDDPLARWELV